MNATINRRDAHRIILGPNFGISFTLKGQVFGEVGITNISAGGCFALIEKRDAGLFERGAVLENLLLHHPELPKTPILAAVCYVQGCRPAAESPELVGIGIHFLSVDDLSQKLLDAWVSGAMERVNPSQRLLG